MSYMETYKQWTASTVLTEAEQAELAAIANH